MKQYLVAAAIIALFFLVVGGIRYGVVPAVIGAAAVFAVVVLIGRLKTRSAVAPKASEPPAA